MGHFLGIGWWEKNRVIPFIGFYGLESTGREFSDDLDDFYGVLLIGFVAVDISWDCADLWGLMVIYVDITNYIRDYNWIVVIYGVQYGLMVNFAGNNGQYVHIMGFLLVFFGYNMV